MQNLKCEVRTQDTRIDLTVTARFNVFGRFQSALCDVGKVEEAKEVLTALEKGGQKNTVDEVTMLGVAWLHTDDRAKGAV